MIQPKNTNNKTYASLPVEVTQAVEKELSQTFEEIAKTGTFFCQIRIYRTEMVLRSGYVKKGEIRQVNFDLSKKIIPEKPEPVKTLEFLIAASKDLFHTYFKHKRTEEFSPVWADFSGTNFSGTNFSETSFSESNFSESNFSESNFSESNFSESNFSESNFSESNFSESDISYRYDATNTKLESKANELLGEEALESTDEQMIQGDFSELEELEEIVETLRKHQK